MAPKLAATVGLVLAAALTVPATAARPRAGAFTGSTDQGRAISFQVTRGGGKVKELEVTYRGRCENGSGILGTTTFTGKYPVNDGAFVARHGRSVLRGEFTTKRRARGTFEWRSAYVDPVTGRSVSCRTRALGWGARRGA
jgi:hypothetical protein